MGFPLSIPSHLSKQQSITVFGRPWPQGIATTTTTAWHLYDSILWCSQATVPESQQCVDGDCSAHDQVESYLIALHRSDIISSPCSQSSETSDPSRPSPPEALQRLQGAGPRQHSRCALRHAVVASLGCGASDGNGWEAPAPPKFFASTGALASSSSCTTSV